MFKTLLKFLLAAALVIWLLKSGKLDFNLIPRAINQGPQWIFAIFLLIIQGSLAAIRFKWIIEIKTQKKFTILEIIRLNWIGMFFSSILPGAVTGDLIKLFYIKKHDTSLTKTFLFTSVMLDRILGLIGLLFICGFFSLVYFNEVTAISPKVLHIIQINFLLFAGGVSFFILLLSPKKLQKFINHFLFKIPKIGQKIVNILEQIFILNEHRKVFIKCFLLSIFTQFIGVFSFWLVTNSFYNHPLPLPYAFTFIPIGLIAIAVPISPAGLGVGHALFQNLFSLVHIDNGASLFNLNFVIVLFVNLLGIIPYLLAGKKPTEQEMEEFNRP